MRGRKLEVAMFVGLGVVLGFAIASYRTFLPEQAVAAGGGDTKNKKPGAPSGIFSPPGTTDTGPVTPPPGAPPFQGKIGRTVAESTPYWPP